MAPMSKQNKSSPTKEEQKKVKINKRVALFFIQRLFSNIQDAYTTDPVFRYVNCER